MISTGRFGVMKEKHQGVLSFTGIRDDSGYSGYAEVIVECPLDISGGAQLGFAEKISSANGIELPKRTQYSSRNAEELVVFRLVATTELELNDCVSGLLAAQSLYLSLRDQLNLGINELVSTLNAEAMQPIELIPA